MAILFKRTEQLEAEIDEFLDRISEGIIVFREGIRDYLAQRSERFAERLTDIDGLEATADRLCDDVENSLYTFSLIPENRGDVLALLETTDDMIDSAKETLACFSVEQPEIPSQFAADFSELAEVSVNGAEAAVLSVRAFFRDLKAVKNHLHKVLFYEKEADRIGDVLKRRIFKLDIELTRKIHLRFFVDRIAHLSDTAENVADRLAIYSIKRTM